MSKETDDLQLKLQAVSTNLAAIAETKDVLDGYFKVRDEYTQLAIDKKVELDALTNANQALLKELSAAITAAYP